MTEIVQRYRILFFPRKSRRPLTHSNLEKIVFFFFTNRGKKKIQLIFFPKTSSSPPNQGIETEKVFIKKASQIYFRNLIFCCIFFSCIFFLVFFFSWKSWNSLTHSFQKYVFFFPHGWKKKIQCFYSLTRFWAKLSQKCTLPGKK